MMALKFSEALLNSLKDTASLGNIIDADENPLRTMAKIELFRPSLPSLVSEVSEINPETGKKKRVLVPKDSWADLSTIMGAQASMVANAALADISTYMVEGAEGGEGQGARKKPKVNAKIPMHTQL